VAAWEVGIAETLLDKDSASGSCKDVSCANWFAKETLDRVYIDPARWRPKGLKYDWTSPEKSLGVEVGVASTGESFEIGGGGTSSIGGITLSTCVFLVSGIALVPFPFT